MLVDPDNRRPVDFDRRRCALREVDAALDSPPAARSTTLREWLENWADGRIKMAVTVAGLRLRRALPDVFLGGAYLPLATDISVSGGAIAFARRSSGDGEAVVFVAPRLCSRLVSPAQPFPLGVDCWKTSRVMLPPELRDRQFRDAITGVDIRPTHGGETAWIFVGEALQTLPVAILRAVLNRF